MEIKVFLYFNPGVHRVSGFFGSPPAVRASFPRLPNWKPYCPTKVSLLCHTPWSRHAFFIVRVFSTVGEAGPVEAQELGSVGPTPTSRIGGRPFESVPLWQKKKKLIPQFLTWQEAASQNKSVLSLQLCGHLGHEPTGSSVRQSNKGGERQGERLCKTF